MGQNVDYPYLATLSSAERLVVVSRLFDAQWKSGSVPQIARFLLMVPGLERAVLLTRLVDLDVAHRRMLGEAVSPAEYLDMYPHDSADLRDQLRAGAESDDGGIRSTQTFHLPLSSAIPDIPAVIPSTELTGLITPPPARRLGRYVLSRELGKGAFGQVYRALDPELGREVAVKTMLKKRATGATADKQFLDEARKIAKLNHPGIIQVYDVGCDHDEYYIVSELVPGGTLADLLKLKRFKWTEAATMVAEIADALHFAHLQGIIHRDLKPQNILIDGHGKPRIADFGLAVTEEEQLREAVGALGTYAYMPPEVMNGGCNFADSRSDVYSMGSILYQLLTDRLLFPAKTRDEWRVLILEKSPRLPSSIDDRIPAEIERVCLKCLSRNPSDRYTTAQDLACELRELVSAASVLAFQAKQDSQLRSRKGHGLAAGERWAVPVALLIAVVAISVAILLPGQRDAAIPAGAGAGVIQEVPVIPAVPAVPVEPAELIDFDQFPDHSELGILTGPIDTWIRALKKPPKILLMPADKRNSNIRYIRKESEVFLTTNGVGLLEIGETSQPDFDFQFKLKQNAWEGGIGAFVGYQDASEHGLGRKRCAFIFLERIELLGSLQLVGMLSLALIDQDGQILNADKVQVIKASRPSSAVSQNRQHEFKLRIRDHKLDSVSFNSDESDFPQELKSKLGLWPSGSGVFGLYLARASGHFRNVHLRILSPSEAKSKVQ